MRDHGKGWLGVFAGMLLLLLLGGAPVVPAAHGADAERTLNAFSITKDTNSNVVKYDVRLRPDCTIDPGDPLDIYWITSDGQGKPRREGLNFIEKGLYNMDFSRRDPHTVVGEVKAIKRKGRDLPVRISVERKGADCRVAAFISGDLPEELQVSSLRLEDFHGQNPAAIGISGRLSASHRPQTYTIRLG